MEDLGYSQIVIVHANTTVIQVMFHIIATVIAIVVGGNF
jgi:hypothetical protein